ncbi:MAG: hypothetical protein IVW54_06760 [Candidatus Binataceae bacterium]|nr:hypothetical protein [Candidatus Binataceae bacterium]
MQKLTFVLTSIAIMVSLAGLVPHLRMPHHNSGLRQSHTRANDTRQLVRDLSSDGSIDDILKLSFDRTRHFTALQELIRTASVPILPYTAQLAAASHGPRAYIKRIRRVGARGNSPDPLV